MCGHLKSSSDLKSWDVGIEVTASATGDLIHEIDKAEGARFFCFVYQPIN